MLCERTQGQEEHNFLLSRAGSRGERSSLVLEAKLLGGGELCTLIYMTGSVGACAADLDGGAKGRISCLAQVHTVVRHAAKNTDHPGSLMLVICSLASYGELAMVPLTPSCPL